MKILRILGITIVVLGLLGWLGWRMYWGPDPEEILASIEVPPDPAFSPQEELATFRIAEGFRVELVASEPLVFDPVAMDWDEEGRLYVVEMRGYMPDVDGNGEDAPIGSIAILEDTDGDGEMDRRDVFLEELVMPRAIAVLPEGVLIAEPPNLWLCRDTDNDRRCDEKIRLAEYATNSTNPEHLENALLPGLDGWIYNATSDRRFRLTDDQLEIRKTQRRGQFGLAQDDEGRLYYNHNSGFLYVDTIPADYVMRQPGVAARVEKAGVNEALTDGEEVHGIRYAAGLNRAYVPGVLRADGTQQQPTAVSGVAIQRGDQFGAEWAGDAFVPEAGGSVVAHFALQREGNEVTAEHRLYPDPDWGKREFLASTHERFRPVDVKVGPDGALWVIDMYRGVIQHAAYVSDHLRTYIGEHDLEPPGATGRIWRIVREDRPLRRNPPALQTSQEQLAGLDHENGWVRDRAQRRLAFEEKPEAITALRNLDDFGPLGKRHALWTLHAMGELDVATWSRGLRDPDPQVRIVALRAGENLDLEDAADQTAKISARLEDSDPGVRLQASYALGFLPAEQRPLDAMLTLGRNGDALQMQSVISGLSGLEETALARELQRKSGRADNESHAEWLAQLATAAHFAAQSASDTSVRAAALLDLLASSQGETREAILSGVETALRSPGNRRVLLDTEHPVFAESTAGPADDLHRIRPGFTWPGDPRPGGARPLTAEESARREKGRELFLATCAPCHGPDGQGTKGRAPSLVGSPWVRDSDDWLVRIVLNGLTGPLIVDGVEWNLTMPGHRDDSAHFDDESIAGLLTHLRRSFGHGEDPVTPESVARIRAETADRSMPWTIAELRELPIEHRLDRYVGLYEIPIVGIQLLIERQDGFLKLGRPGTGSTKIEEAGNGLFHGPGVAIQFQTDAKGTVEGAEVQYGETSIPVSRIE